jgi:hypothetical protein
MDAPSLISILDARCGDMLKAYVLKKFYPDLNINLCMVRQPTGEVEAAFANARASEGKPAEEPAARALQEFREDHKRLKFESIDPVAEARRAALPKVKVVDGKPAWEKPEEQGAREIIAAEQPEQSSVVDGEFLIDGKLYVTKERAGALRGCGLDAVAAAAAKYKWARNRHPYIGKSKVYLKEQVLMKYGKALA